jgi:hypothetical protein
MIGIAVALVARLRRATLDQALVEGADPVARPLVAARAAQLSTRSARARLAGGLERLALAGEEPPGRVRVAPSRSAVLANRADLLDLAGVLRRGGALYAQGVAMLELVLIDGTGPAYTDGRGEGLSRQLSAARTLLAG